MMIPEFFAKTTKLFHATLVRTTTLAVVLDIARMCSLLMSVDPNANALLPALAMQLLLLPLSAAVLTPVAWVATLGRSVIAGIGCTIGIVVLAQVGVLTGPGAWLTFAAPGL
ncbi:hypothetical protein ACIGB6_11875 [Paeniglutamicibacter gangotriensis]|uniref:hypothetical protein n=1 Tax=Paeniglutamicibacter gangotriensis TaxID=254787 RepID=UPI0037C599B8